jgi:hypothetical protein
MTRLIWIVGCLMASSDRRQIARESVAGRERTPRDFLHTNGNIGSPRVRREKQQCLYLVMNIAN